MTADSERTVVLVSPLPPPAGGIATWTEVLLRRGLPAPWRADIVNTARRSGAVFVRGSLLGELRRTLRIWAGTMRAVWASRTPALIHLNVDPLSLGLLRDVACGGVGFLRGVPFVLHHHGDVTRIEHAPAWRRALFRLAVRSAALNVVMTNASHAFVAALCADSPSGVVNLPNFYDETIPIAAHDPALRARPRVLFVGGLTRAKGCLAVCEVARRVPEADFVLLGRRYPDTATALADAPGNLEICGEVSSDDVAARLARSDLLLFPSNHAEGFPYSVLEAMTAGLPVISTRAGAIGEMIDEGLGGFLTDPLDVEEMALRVRELLADAPRRRAFGEHNREKARRLYAFDVVSGSLAELYAKCAR